MNKKLVMAITLLLSGHTAVAETNKDWNLISFTDSNMFFFNPKSIISDGKLKKTWIKTLDTKDKTYTKTLMKANCSNSTLRMDTAISYSADGSLLKTIELGSQERDVPSESIGGLIVTAICTGKGFVERNK